MRADCPGLSSLSSSRSSCKNPQCSRRPHRASLRLQQFRIHMQGKFRSFRIHPEHRSHAYVYLDVAMRPSMSARSDRKEETVICDDSPEFVVARPPLSWCGAPLSMCCATIPATKLRSVSQRQLVWDRVSRHRCFRQLSSLQARTSY